MKINGKISVICAFLGFAFTPSFSYADHVLAQHFVNTQSVQTVDLPALGSVPTFHVNLPLNEMAALLWQDQNDGRIHFDRNKPSLLDKHLIKLENSPVGSSSSNGFSQGNSYVCITVVATNVPWYQYGTSTTSVTTTNASRTCTTNYTPISRSDTATMTKFYNSYQVTSSSANNSIEYGKVMVLRPSSMPVENSTMMVNEGWGIALFDQPGPSGRLQEVVWTSATYINK